MLVSIFIFLALEKYMVSIKVVQEEALRVELSNLRRSIMYFTAAKQRLPESLQELVRLGAIAARYDIEAANYNIIISGSYTERMTLDDDGYPTDTFGNRFRYDTASGRAWPGTADYEKW